MFIYNPNPFKHAYLSYAKRIMLQICTFLPVQQYAILCILVQIRTFLPVQQYSILIFSSAPVTQYSTLINLGDLKTIVTRTQTHT